MSLIGRLQDGPLRLRRLKDGATGSQTASGTAVLRTAPCDASAVLQTHCAFLHPQRLDGAHEAIRVNFALFSPKTSTVLRLAYFNAAS